jgi:hypothetical protein
MYFIAGETFDAAGRVLHLIKIHTPSVKWTGYLNIIYACYFCNNFLQKVVKKPAGFWDKPIWHDNNIPLYQINYLQGFAELNPLCYNTLAQQGLYAHSGSVNQSYRISYRSIPGSFFFLEFGFLDIILFSEDGSSFSACTEKTILNFLIIDERIIFIGRKLPIFDKHLVVVMMSAFVIVILPSYRTVGVN